MNRRIIALAAAGLTMAAPGVALGLDLWLTPEAGPPGSTITARVACEKSPDFYSYELREGFPAGTQVPLTGVQSADGEWAFEVVAGKRDEVVSARCGDDFTSGRFDVENPSIFPGPTWVGMGGWDHSRENTTLVGTDCPAGPATVAFRVGDLGEIVTVELDPFGDWEAPVPADLLDRAEPVTASATCGGIDYGSITFGRDGVVETEPTPVPTASLPTTEPTPETSPSTAPTATPSAPAASPVTGQAGYTG